MNILLSWLQKNQAQHSVFPIFIPFAGCKERCIFCAQDIQSGTKFNSIISILNTSTETLKQLLKNQRPASELGFFGGTFTAIDQSDFTLCLNFVREQKLLGHIAGARCSTRPDALDAKIVTSLKNAGFGMVELGVQSFNNNALELARRGYNNDIAKKACHLVSQQGLELGIQLMPGMPGVSPEIFLDDVQKALDYGAKILRFYPCQVIKGTELEKLWREKKYIPWTLEQTVNTLAQAWLMALKAQVPVIRMGLAPEAGLEQAIVAGPNHPALGSIVQACALYNYIKHALNGKQAKAISLPRSCQGFFGGQKNSLLEGWKKLGISKQNITWSSQEHIDITV